MGRWNVDFRKPDSKDRAKIARIVIDESGLDTWDGAVPEARSLIKRICIGWPSGYLADYLIACGGFVVADWPENLNIRRARDATLEERKEIADAAECCSAKLLNAELIARLRKVCEFFSFGVDVFLDDDLTAPHSEMVCLFETTTGKRRWTCKFLPTEDQKANLVMPFDMDTHFINCGKDHVMLLGCNDLWAFVKRGRKHFGKTAKDRAREEIARLSRVRGPTVVLQHAHTSDFVRTWIGAWGGLKKLVGDSLKTAAGAGRHPRKAKRKGKLRPTDPLDRILAATRIGPTMDIIVKAN